jgi:flavin reductase
MTERTLGPNSQELFKQGMRRLAAGVSIVTTMQDDRPYGFAATSVTSVSAEPDAILLVCVSKSVSCRDAILKSGFFCVSVLGEGDAQTARLFSSPQHRSRRFENTEWEIMSTGAPALKNALANFDCRIREAVEVQTHSVLFGEVREIRLRGREIRPLLYVNGYYDGLRSALAGDQEER